MPHVTLKAAEQAALEGNVTEVETQDCLNFQLYLLSSPANPPTPDHVASNFEAVSNDSMPRTEPEQNEDEEVDQKYDEQRIDDGVDDDRDGTHGIHQIIQRLSESHEPDAVPQEDAIFAEQVPVATIQIRRDAKGKLRRFAMGGEEVNSQAYFEQRVRATLVEVQRREMDDDLTQKSSMSLTQENPESAYKQFDIQQAIHDEFPSTATPADAEEQNLMPDRQHDSYISKQHASARTESTAYTYQEQDTGHVKIDFVPDIQEEMDELDDMDDDQSQSQDASFAAPQIGLHFGEPSYDPQTPAAPVNPFSHKGSVMKASELFGATQPSSAFRHGSPTSSRPSPDVYNDFTSPPKRQRIGSSPLGRLQEVDVQTSPLQSSVRNLLANSMPSDLSPATILRTPGVHSFTVGPRHLDTESVPKPRYYVSMKESQEKRRRDNSHFNSDSESSDSNDSVTRKRKRESRIQRELSTVALPPKQVPVQNRPSASASASASASPAVEVPSTGRRRSIQEDYIAQFEGLDARDTQQDDRIADSQGAPDLPALDNSLPKGKAAITEVEIGSDFNTADTPSKLRHEVNETRSYPQEAGSIPEDELHIDRQGQPENGDTANDTESSIAQPSLPLKESSGNSSNLRTPVGSKKHLLSDGLDTVPETSPPEERIGRMGEIATISFRETQFDMNDLPGFTQDSDFEKAIAMNQGSPQRPISRPRSFRNSLLSPAAEPAKVDSADLVTDIEAELPPQSTEGPASSPDIPSTLPGQGRPSVTESMPPIAAVSDAGPSPEKRQEPEIGLAPVLVPEIPAEQAPKEVQQGTDEDLASEEQNEVQQNAQIQRMAEDEAVSELGPAAMDSNNPDDSEAMQGPAEQLSAKQTGMKQKGKKIGRSYSRKGSTRKSQTSQPNTRVTQVKESSASSTPTSTTRIDLEPAERSITRSQARRGKTGHQSTPAPTTKRTTKRQLGATSVKDVDTPNFSTRASKRQSIANIAREDSEDPLAHTPASTLKHARSRKSGSGPGSGLFERMAFAVSYVKNDQERDSVTKLIQDNGGRILQDGFDALFSIIPKTACEDVELSLLESAASLGFTALIADEHSRKAKFMQALALGLPCISGRWVSACLSKSSVLDWTPYLLCAGQSSFLGNAIRSRTIKPYAASDAILADVFSGRDKLLQEKSILLVTGKGKTEEKRKAYLFLTRALGPARVNQVVDYQEARKHLVEAESNEQSYDLLYVEKDEQVADSVVFGAGSTYNGAAKKRKRGPVDTQDLPTPKKIRIIADEIIVQSLILGQLLEEDESV